MSGSALAQDYASAALNYGVPLPIVQAVAQWESGQGSTSGNIMGLTPATAAALGVNEEDPASNISGGAQLLSQLYQKYGQWGPALSVYNTGVPNSPAGTQYASNVLGTANQIAGSPAYSTGGAAAGPTSSTVGAAPAAAASGPGVGFYLIAIVLIVLLVAFGLYGLIKEA